MNIQHSTKIAKIRLIFQKRVAYLTVDELKIMHKLSLYSGSGNIKKNLLRILKGFC